MGRRSPRRPQPRAERTAARLFLHMENSLLVAIVLKPQGIRGEIKVKTFTDAAEDLSAFERVYIGGNEYKLLSVRAQGDCAYVTLRGVADRNAAELLRGKEVYVLRSDAPALPENTFYIVDLIGCGVFTEEGEELGTLVGVTPAKTDIYTVDMGGKEVMFAGVQGVILSIDPSAEKIVVNGKRFREVAVLD